MNRRALQAGMALILALVAGNALASATARCLEVPPELDLTSVADIQRAAAGAPRLARALGQDRRSLLRRFLKEGDNPNICLLGSSLLAVAVSTGDMEEAVLLLDHGALVDSPRDSDGGTPLLTAASARRFGMARMLLARGADPKSASDGGLTVLHQLAMASEPDASDNEESVSLALSLVEAGVDIDARATPSGITPLMFAALRGNQALAELLKSRGADLSLRDAKGQTAQDFALKKGFSDIAVLLQPNRTDREASAQ